MSNEARSGDRQQVSATSMDGQISRGLVAVTSADDPGHLLGYAYTEPYTSGGGQLERWMLFEQPYSKFALTPSEGTAPVSDLRDWQALVRASWRPKSFYVWAYADVYAYGGTYDRMTWTKIPPPLASHDGLPPPPEGARAPWWNGDAWTDQTDPDVTGVTQTMDNRQWIKGSIYTEDGLISPSSTEYWALPPGFQPAGAQGIVTRIAPLGVGLVHGGAPVTAARAAGRSLVSSVNRLGPKLGADHGREMMAALLRNTRQAWWRAQRLASALGGDPGTKLQTFIDGVNAYHWSPGAALVVTTCFNHQPSDDPPLNP